MNITELQQAIAAKAAPIREWLQLDEETVEGITDDDDIEDLVIGYNAMSKSVTTLLKLLGQQTEIINALQHMSQSLSGILLDMKLPKQVRDECAGKIQSLAESFDKELKAIARELDDEY